MTEPINTGKKRSIAVQCLKAVEAVMSGHLTYI
jgi:hypothetical protein